MIEIKNEPTEIKFDYSNLKCRKMDINTLIKVSKSVYDSNPYKLFTYHSNFFDNLFNSYPKLRKYCVEHIFENVDKNDLNKFSTTSIFVRTNWNYETNNYGNFFIFIYFIYFF